MIRRLAAVFALLASASTTAQAASADDQLVNLVSQELRFYVPGVDAGDLSRRQLNMIYGIMHSDMTESQKRLHIRSAIGGRLSLRGALFR